MTPLGFQHLNHWGRVCQISTTSSWVMTLSETLFLHVSNVLRTHQSGADRASDVAALQNEQVVYVPDDNYGNPLREAKHQPDLLKDYFNHVGALFGQEGRI